MDEQISIKKKKKHKRQEKYRNKEGMFEINSCRI